MEKKRLDQLLIERNLVATRNKAQELIKENKVMVNKEIITKPSKKILLDSKIEIFDNQTLLFVSRGGLKLKKAIDDFDIHIKDKICLDIGASTGGFSDCLLQYGAEFVYTIDVGTSQLVDKIKNSNRVKAYENLNFKDATLSLFDKEINLIVCDVSFISIQKIIDKVTELFSKIEMVVLLKPQFEIGKIGLNKQGVVSKKKDHYYVLNSFIDYLKTKALSPKNIIYSPIIGHKKGNIEYLFYLTSEEYQNNINIKRIVDEAFKVLRGEEND